MTAPDTDLMEERLAGRTSEAQAARTDRMIRAAIELAGQGGYEAVQMREVARMAGVALATLYRYYPSKNELLLAAVDHPGHELALIRVHGEDGGARDDAHLLPVLLVVRLPGVHARQVVVLGVDEADVAQRLAPRLAGEDFVYGLDHNRVRKCESAKVRECESN